MKYCTNCGSKLENDAKFCTGCGGYIVEDESQKKLIKKEKNDVSMQKVILILGVFLVLFASFIFGIFSWNGLSPEFRISFFGFETILFFVFALVLKKIESKLNKLFFIIGLIMIPYTISLVPYYGLISSYIANGTGLFVYLAICYLFTAFLYILIDYVFKSKALNYLGFVALFISYICFCCIVTTQICDLIMLSVIFFTIFHLVSYLKIFAEETRKIVYYFSSFGLYIFIALFGVFLFIEKGDFTLQNTITIILFAINCFANIEFHKDSPFIYVSSAMLPLALAVYSFSTFSDLDGVYIFIPSIIIYYFISIILNKKVNLLSLIISYVFIGTCMYILLVGSFYINSTDEYIFALFITTTLLLVFNILNIIVNKYKIINFFIPVNIILSFVFLFMWIKNIDLLYISMALCSIFELLYFALKYTKSKLSICYLITTMVLLFINLTFSSGGFNFVNIAIVAQFLLLYILSYVFKEENYIKIPLFVLLNISLIFMFYKINPYYSLLAISALTISISMIINKVSKINLKPYILYGEIVLLIITLFGRVNYNPFIIIIHLMTLLLGLYSLIKNFNYKPYKIAYLVISLLFIERYICFLIEPVVLSTIVCACVTGIILVILYLTDVEDGLSLSITSIALLFPYYNLFFHELLYIKELLLLPLVIYDVLITSVIKFKNEKTRFYLTIIPLSVLTYGFVLIAFVNLGTNSISSIIFDVILGLLYISLGLLRKYNSFIFLGIILIVVTLFIRLFTILNSVAIVLILILIGFALIGISVYSILRKQKE